MFFRFCILAMFSFSLFFFSVQDVSTASASNKSKSNNNVSFRLGKFYRGMALKQVIVLLGKPVYLNKPVHHKATGTRLRAIMYPKVGLRFGLVSKAPKGSWKLDSIEAKPSCQLKTGQGIGIGSSRKAVQAAYKQKDAMFSNKSQYVAGSILGGRAVIFGFDKHQRVKSIFIGSPR